MPCSPPPPPTMSWNSQQVLVSQPGRKRHRRWSPACLASNCSIIDRIASCKHFYLPLKIKRSHWPSSISSETSLTHLFSFRLVWFEYSWLHQRDGEWVRHSIRNKFLNSFMIKFSFSRCHERIYRFELWESVWNRLESSGERFSIELVILFSLPCTLHYDSILSIVYRIVENIFRSFEWND